MSTLSPFITPVPGMSYVGKIVLHDVANNLTFEKQITYIAPITLPTGIGIMSPPQREKLKRSTSAASVMRTLDPLPHTIPP